jgi:serine/threonine protein kinase
MADGRSQPFSRPAEADLDASDGCPPADAITALLAGNLSPEEASKLHGHFRICKNCSQLLTLLAAGSGPSATSVDERSTNGFTSGESGSAEPRLPGSRAGRFTLQRLIGMGGMGAVWAAEDPELHREVAVKLLRAGIGSDVDRAEAHRRLRLEATTMARLAHPNVVPVFEVGETDGEQLFLVMELVEGETLRSWLATPRTLEQILDAFVAAGRGLAAAHAAGIVHRDFKPENVLIGNDGRPRVTDFGLARRARSDSDAEEPVRLEPPPTTHGSLTPLGAVMGTPAYMAPEQLAGERADARSDLFAFCTALYEAVAGTRPFPAGDVAALLARTESGAIEPPTRPVPRWLRRELQRGLQLDPAQRHA